MTNKTKLSEFAELELDLPKVELPAPAVDISSAELQHDNHNIDADDEGAVVKADLYKLAKYSVKLFKKIEDEDQFESWVQAKITKAADYISSVYHYLEYEMKFSEYGDKIENSDMYSESEKRQMKNALMEAKKSLAALKINQAEKLDKTKTVKESVAHTCGECGGTGMVEKPLPEATKAKVEKYNRQAKAFHAASKRLDKNNNGIPDDMESDAGGEEFETKPKKAAPKKEGGNPFAKKSKDSDTESKSETPKKSAPKKEKSEKDDSKTESMFGGSVYGESVTPVKKSSGVADKKGKNPFAKKDDAKKNGGNEFGKALDKARSELDTVKESAKQKAKKDYDKDGKIETGEEEHKGAVDKAIKSAKTESVEFNAIMRNSGLAEAKDDMGYDMSPEEVAAQQRHDAEWSMPQEPMPQGGKPISDKDWKRAQQRMPGLFGPGADERQWAELDRDTERLQQRHEKWADQLRQDQYARMQQTGSQNQDQDAAAKRAYFSTHPDEFAKYVAAQQRNQQLMNNPQMAVDQENAARTQEQANQYLEKQKQNQGWFQESAELTRLKMITERVIK